MTRPGDRTCPGCFGPISLVETGKDARGFYEVWRCDRACNAISSTTSHHGTPEYRDSDVVLRDADYGRTIEKRERIAAAIAEDHRAVDRRAAKAAAAE